MEGAISLSGWWDLVWPLLTVVGLPWLVYWDMTQRGGWVSDDSQDANGIAHYRGEFTWWPPVSEKRRFTQDNQPSWMSLGRCLKKFRYEFGKRPNPNRAWKAANQPQFVPSQSAHHRLNIWFLSGVAGLLYLFLARHLSPHIAWLATLLFVAHPLGSQTTAWCSGVPYVIGAWWMLLGLHVADGWGALWHGGASLPTVLGVGALFTVCQWLACETIFVMMGAWLILLWLGAWPLALVAMAIALRSALGTFKEAVTLRASVFHDQGMGAATKFHARKVFVAMKALWYNLRLVAWPKRMGLYHTFQYHYELPYVEWEDHHAYLGLACLAGLGWGVWWGPPAVQLACLWFVAFAVLFLGWIIANQFVVDRYMWLPSVAACLLAAALLPTWAVATLVGIALMRTWGHLPSYYNEPCFYLSNLWNFPMSEVAMGNLGVSYMNQNFVGAATDMWVMGVKMNPEYDVNWYNLSSMMRTRGPFNPNYIPQLGDVLPKDVVDRAMGPGANPNLAHLVFSHYCLWRALTARTCHYQERWRKELYELEAALTVALNKALVVPRPVGVPG